MYLSFRQLDLLLRRHLITLVGDTMSVELSNKLQLVRF
jgi:hypothetical protein